MKTAILIYKDGLFLKKIENVTCNTLGFYMRGLFKNKDGYTFEYEDKEYQKCVEMLREYLRDESDLREEYITELLEFSIQDNIKNEAWYRENLSKYEIQTLYDVLQKFKRKNSKLHSFKDFTLFEEVE